MTFTGAFERERWAVIQADFDELINGFKRTGFASHKHRRVALAAVLSTEPQQNLALWLVLALEALMDAEP